MTQEIVRIVIGRKGDHWSILAVQRSQELRAFAPLEVNLADDVAGGSSPGGLLELVGQELDTLEAERLDQRLRLAPEPAPLSPPTDEVIETRMGRVDLVVAPGDDLGRVLEVLEDLAGRPATTATVARLAGFITPGAMGSDGRLRVLHAARELERRGAAIMTQHPIRQGDYLIGHADGARAIRAAAADDPRGEADR